jgi:hypothetical protein
VRAELAPSGALQADLVTRIVTAPWRARRADRMEAALLRRYLADIRYDDAQTALGYGLMRDGNGPRALETLVRYRGSVLAELFGPLAALEARQTQAQSVTGGGPALLELTCVKTKRIRERRPEQPLGSQATRQSAS